MSVVRTLVITVLIIAAAAIAGMAYTGTLSKAFPMTTDIGSVNTGSAEDNDAAVIQAKNVQFGADFESLNYVRKTNWEPEYVTLWVGDWVEKDQYGWDTVERFVRTAHSKGATPVIIWSYWGSDLSQDALASGTNGKSVKAWDAMGEELATKVSQFSGGKEVVVVVEPEFNKNDIEKYKPFDAMLAKHVGIFEAHDNLVTVVGFGNWNHYNFLTFEESIQAADMIGINSVRFYPNHQKDYYESVTSDAVETVRFLAVNFDQKPIMIYDFAISASDADLVEAQEAIVKDMCSRLGEMEESGLKVVIYRYLVDPVKYVPAEERHWGLIEETGKAKPALDDWLSCINNVESAGSATTNMPAVETAAPASE